MVSIAVIITIDSEPGWSRPEDSGPIELVFVVPRVSKVKSIAVWD
jgi:hypothetical protein